ncbi:hypothetical protein [Sulfurisphaera ohwakuensis]|uniref:hypothetical protein n=1 Tax=Sulfurisphaera ohwakuensis TaxID=69656 RepID=UPI0036F34AEE
MRKKEYEEAEDLDDVTTWYSYRYKVFEVKSKLLKKLKVQELDEIIDEIVNMEGDYIAEIVDPLEDVDKIIKNLRKLSKDLKKEEKVEYLSFLDLDVIKNICKKAKIPYSEVMEELEKYANKLERKKKRLEKIRDVIETIYSFQPIREKKERDLQQQLYQYLVAKLPRNNIEVEKPISGYKIDISINDKIGVEIKYPKSNSDLQRLVGQISIYSKHFDYVLPVIFAKKGSLDLVNFIYEIEENENVKAIVKKPAED